MAQRTAEAMLGEEARCGEFLKEVVSVKKTDEEANLMSWTREHTEYIWQRVLNNLGLRPEEVEFFPSELDKKGLIFKRSPLN